jgi:hypothetical protein
VKKVGATVLLWVGGILAFMLGFAGVVYVHENWPALEAPAVFIFLALGIVLGVIALRMHGSLAEKIAGGASIVCIGLSIAFAIVHGWEDAVRIIFAAAALAYFVGVVWFVRQSVRCFHAAMESPAASDQGEASEQAILAEVAEP